MSLKQLYDSGNVFVEHWSQNVEGFIWIVALTESFVDTTGDTKAV
jgi:hypothetical protein